MLQGKTGDGRTLVHVSNGPNKAGNSADASIPGTRSISTQSLEFLTDIEVLGLNTNPCHRRSTPRDWREEGQLVTFREERMLRRQLLIERRTNPCAVE